MGLSLDLAFEPVTVWEEFMTTSRRWEASPHHHITVSPDPTPKGMQLAQPEQGRVGAFLPSPVKCR